MQKFMLFITLQLSSILGFSQALVLTPAKPEAGKEVSFVYTGPHIRDTLKTSPFLRKTILNKNLMVFDTLHLVRTQTGYTGKFKVEDSVTTIMFLIGEQVGPENNYFVYPVYKNGVQVKGASAGMAMQNMWAYQLGVTVDNKKNGGLFEEEFHHNPDQEKIFIIDYLKTLSAIPEREAEAKTLAEQAFRNALESGQSENEVIQLASILYDEESDKRAAYEDEMVKKFPKGISYGNRLLKELYDLQKEKKYDTVIEKALRIKTEEVVKNVDYMDEQLNRILMNSYKAKKDYTKFEEYAELEESFRQKAYNYNDMALNMAKAKQNLDIAKHFSKLSLDNVDSLYAINSRPNISAREWKRLVDSEFAEYVNTYALILYALGDKAGALANQQKIIDIIGVENVESNERYILYLFENDKIKESLETAEDCISKGKSNAGIDSLYKVIYLAVHKNSDNFTDRLAMLKKQGKKYEIARLQKDMLNIDTPDFSLTDQSGKKITRNDLKGKIVILDFWATWCGPCVASLPAMLKAAAALKHRKDVVFYFVNTQERGSAERRKKKVNEFLSKNKYDLNLLFDLQDKAYYDFEINGIPANFIIGKDGKIKFSSSGFGDNDEELVNELTMMVESLQ